MIDVIIPAYNAHKTIIDTLVSLELQTVIDKINILIINDGSTIDYKKLKNRFKNLNISLFDLKNNKGPGYARDYGLKHSNSKFVYFLDSDDLLINMFSLEILINEIKDNDIIAGKVAIENSKNEISEVKITNYDLHAKLFRREYIEKNHFNFNHTYRSEDNSFYRLLRVGTTKYKEVDLEIEVYSYNNNSITNSDKNYKLNEAKYITKNMIWFEKEASKRNFDPKKIIESMYPYLSYFLSTYINYYSKTNISEVEYGIIYMNKMIKKYKKYVDIDIIFQKLAENISAETTKELYKIIFYKIINKK